MCIYCRNLFYNLNNIDKKNNYFSYSSSQKNIKKPQLIFYIKKTQINKKIF